MVPPGGEHRPPVALAFPGQGGDWSAGIEIVAGRPDHPLVAALADHLGTERWEELSPLDPAHAQPVILIAGLVAASRIDAPLVQTVVGHSFGEITAACWAGALEVPAALEAVGVRAAIGRAAQVARPAAMAVVMRWDRDQLDELRGELTAPGEGTLEVAVRNSPTQHVLTGDDVLIDRAVDQANRRGAVARRLAIGGGYHSSLLADHVEEFEAALRAAIRRDPAVPVVCSTAPGPWRRGDELARVLARSLVRPVDWPAAVATVTASGVRQAVDAGPGDTLARLARFLPELTVRPIS
ncbi:MAG: ACP S-malonyltransferase [Acidimicrobiales bacterium]|nr:ACP S-malonyltransferase [Acidimicrobiales bacterium]